MVKASVPYSGILLILCVPLLIMLSNRAIIPPLFSIGDADIQSYDVILVLVGCKVVTSIFLGRGRLYISTSHSAIIIFLFILFEATLVAYYQFGREIFIREMVTFIRFLTEVSVFFFLALLIKSERQVEILEKVIEWMGYAIGGTFYLSLVLVHGIKFSEIQTAGVYRYFGPLGDQVGFLLLFFVYRQLWARNVLGALFFMGALLVTGTRGALLTLLVGLIALVWQMYKETSFKFNLRALFLLGAFSGAIGVLVLFDLGGMWSRFTANLFDLSLTQRSLTAKYAARVFWDNPVVGVGYTGFHYIALDYGVSDAFIKGLGSFSDIHIATTTNQYLQVATDGGVLGLISFFWMIAVFLRTLKSAALHTEGRVRHFYLTGYVWLFSLLIGNQSADWLLPESMISYLLWVIVGLAVATNQSYAKFRADVREQTIMTPLAVT